MPSIDTAVFQLSALALLGLILVVAVAALLRLGSLKRALNERPSTTAADVVPFAEADGHPPEIQEEPAAEESAAEPRGEPDREETPPPQDETAASEAQEPARPGPEPEAEAERAAILALEAEARAAEAPVTGAEERGPVTEERDVAETVPERAEPELVRESPPTGAVAPEGAELQPEPVAAEAAEEGAEPGAAAAGAYWPTEEARPEATLPEEEREPEAAGAWGEAPAEGRDEYEGVGVGREEPHDLGEAAGAAAAPTAQQPAVGDAEAPGEVAAAPSTVSAQQQQVAAGAEAESEFAAERTWDAISQQTEAPANGEPSVPEPEGVLTAAWAYDWARDMPEEQPIERDGRWWFKRGGELLLYDETTAQWVPAPMPESPGGNEPADDSNGAEFGGAAASPQSSFWKCPSCGAVNGSTASTCRMCFAARP
jgi:hypothetical protein